jgi:hypothetical protein
MSDLNTLEKLIMDRAGTIACERCHGLDKKILSQLIFEFPELNIANIEMFHDKLVSTVLWNIRYAIECELAKAEYTRLAKQLVDSIEKPKASGEIKP